METMMRASKGNNAFTLIELLIVLGVIALMAAILFPVLASARKRANNDACLSNLRQIGIAISLYSQDYDDTYPYAVSPEDLAHPDHASPPLPPDVVAQLPAFNIVLATYVRNRGCWQCPLDTQRYFEKYGTSYQYNDYLDTPKIIFDPSSSKVPLAYDASDVWHTNTAVTPFMDMDYVNVVYEDLHAKRGTAFDTVLPHLNPSV